ncbi:hypothetical protein C8R43DRAFT_963450 [Mycena crocata]|nr:hypothetical protein C8R43DRAFT_963450 [Mycena crocata]
MSSFVRINIRTKGFKHTPARPPPNLACGVPDYIVAQRDTSLEPHLDFPFKDRLKEELSLRDPPLPFPADPLPEELRPHRRQAVHMPVPRRPALLHAFSDEVKLREAARISAEREHRFRQVQASVHDRLRDSMSRSPSPDTTIKISKGAAVDPGVIEDRDYEYSEVVGLNSTFNMRLIPWGGLTPRAVVTEDSEVVLVLAGRSRNGNWYKEVVEPATPCGCRQRRDANIGPTLAGGVGHTFNEPFVTPTALLNFLVFHQLLATMAMKRLLGFASCVLEEFCKIAFEALQAQKQSYLEHDRRALYPTDSSVFSTAVVELGGPHHRQLAPGVAYPYDALTWCALVALGKYRSERGGHIIFWDLGLVVAFPASSTILIPSGIIRYSFVKVREEDRRYSILQYAGSGIGRWFRNGMRSDMEFAVHTTKEEHTAREECRREAHAAAAANFPHERDIPDCVLKLKFTGSGPEATDPAKHDTTV